MNIASMGRWLVAPVVVALLAIGCTPATGGTPSPSTPPASPSVRETPAETTVERLQRLDYEAAEKSYRTFRAEYRRVLRAGGAATATPTMKLTAGDGYLDETEDVVQGYKSFNYHQVGAEVIVYVRRAGHSEEALVLDVCEDDRPVKALDRRGKSLGSGELRSLRINVKKKGGIWKLWSGTGQKVDSCD